MRNEVFSYIEALAFIVSINLMAFIGHLYWMALFYILEIDFKYFLK